MMLTIEMHAQSTWPTWIYKSHLSSVKDTGEMLLMMCLTTYFQITLLHSRKCINMLFIFKLKLYYFYFLFLITTWRTLTTNCPFSISHSWGRQTRLIQFFLLRQTLILFTRMQKRCVRLVGPKLTKWVSLSSNKLSDLRQKCVSPSDRKKVRLILGMMFCFIH